MTACAGQMVLVVRAGKESTSTVLELWESSRVIAELQIPAKLHGSVFNDGWFSSGAAWDPAERRIAYVAEVGFAPPSDGHVSGMDHYCLEISPGIQTMYG